MNLDTVMNEVQFYGNPKLDSYTDVDDDDCQPVALVSNGTIETKKYCLCVKSVPTKMEAKDLERLVREHGKIYSLIKGHNIPYWFIDCITQSDMESILKGMERNRFGIKVEIKKEKKDEKNHISYDLPIENEILNHNLKDDYSRRVVLTNRTLKYFIENPVPKMLYSFENLGGSLESSAGISRMNSSPKTRNLMLERSRKEAYDSNGSYDSKKGVYEKLSIEFDSMSIGTCKLCGIVCSKYCERCLEHYCSVQCQTEHWTQHRFGCFKIPCFDEPNKFLSGNGNCKSNKSKNNLSLEMIGKNQNEKLNSVVSNINDEYNNRNVLKPTPRADPPPSSSKVIMLFAYCSNKFAVRSADTNHSENYIKILNKINGSAGIAKRLLSLPERNSYCITEYDGIYCRAIVDKVISEIEIHVIYVDFGNAEVRKLSELKELLPELHELMRYPFEVRLKNLENLTTTGNEQFKMLTTELIDGCVQMKLFYDNDNKNGYVINNAELIKVQTNESINSIVLNFLSFDIPNDNDDPIMNTEIIDEDIEIHSNMKLIVFDVDWIEEGILVCIPEDLYPHLKLFEDQLKKYATTSSKGTCPRPNEMCVAEYKGVWRRAKCYEVVGDGNPTLEFIDYGDICPINITKIRKYPKNSNFPCRTNMYEISEVKDLVNGIIDSKTRESAIKLLKELIKVHDIITPSEIFKKIDNLISIKLPYVVEKIRKEMNLI